MRAKITKRVLEGSQEADSLGGGDSSLVVETSSLGPRGKANQIDKAVTVALATPVSEQSSPVPVPMPTIRLTKMSLQYLENIQKPTHHPRWITLTMMPEDKLLDALFRELHPVKEKRPASQREEMIERCRTVFGPKLREWTFICSGDDDQGLRKRYRRSYERLIPGREDYSVGFTPVAQSLSVAVAPPLFLPPYLLICLRIWTYRWTRSP